MLRNSSKNEILNLNHEILGAATTEATSDIDIEGITTGGDGVPPNDVTINVDLGTGGLDVLVTGIGWDVVLDAFDPSWLSEATLAFNDGALTLSPAAGDDAPGIGASYSSNGIVDITAIPNVGGGVDDFSFIAVGGNIDIMFFESFNDLAVDPDGMWASGSTLTIEHQPVPEPSGLAMILILMLGLLGIRKR